MKQAVYPPLALLKRTAAAHPDAWEIIAKLYGLRGTDNVPYWPKWCYAPLSVALGTVATNAYDTTTDMPQAMVIAALAPWRRSKEVYVMDADMQELLFEQADDLKIQPEILKHLPYPCFYVQFAPGTTPYHGFFCHLDYSIEQEETSLRLLFLAADGTTDGMFLLLDAETVEGSIQKVSDVVFRDVPDHLRGALMGEITQYWTKMPLLKQSLQLVLYLCAQNAEITPDPEQQTITRRTATIKDRYAEIRKWDVGIRVGRAVRSYRQSVSAAPGDGSHASPRPHMRRGHWHNFWHGPKSVPEERKLLLQWVAPTFVAANQEDTPVTLHPVRKPKQ